MTRNTSLAYSSMYAYWGIWIGKISTMICIVVICPEEASTITFLINDYSVLLGPAGEELEQNIIPTIS